MPRKYWLTPIYKIHKGDQTITIDVTTSASAGLPAKETLEKLIPKFRKKGFSSIIDVGAGVLRHTLPLLAEGFEVSAVEYEEQFLNPAAKKALEKAKKFTTFTPLVFPKDFINDTRRYDVALLCYVIQVMPIENERIKLLKLICQKLKRDAYLLVMSRKKQMAGCLPENRILDGYYKYPEREKHTFYREYEPEELISYIEDCGFRKIHGLASRQEEQIVLFAKGSALWGDK